MSERGLLFYTYPMPTVLHKPRGKTPLEIVTAWKESEGLPADLPVSYAGRLDPMAEGLLLVLVGDECKEQKRYTKLDKEYVVEVLLGISSDTGDVLGIPSLSLSEPSFFRLSEVLANEVGFHSRAYPAFSSKTVKGKPLFVYALEGTLDTISIPEHIETVYRVSLIGRRELSPSDLSAYIADALRDTPTSDEPSKLLGADFRIGVIKPAWESLLQDSPRTFHVLTLRVSCGSGTYMRTLAERIGKRLGSSGLALSIKRTKIGRYQKLPFGIGFWKKVYT